MINAEIVDAPVFATIGAVANVNGPQAITHHPIIPFLYTGNLNSTISAYKADPISGVLTRISDFAAQGKNPRSVVVHPNGKFLYAANQLDNTISAFNINGTTGTLSPLTPSTFKTGSSPRFITIDEVGNDLYVVNDGDNTIWAYQITPASTFAYLPGSLSPYYNPATNLPGFPTGRGPVSVAVTIHPYIYVANNKDGTISGYKKDQMCELKSFCGNFLNPITGSPFPAGTNPASIVAEPNGKYLYVANSGSGNISGYKIAPLTGVLTAVPYSPFLAGSVPDALAIDISGKFLYATSKASGNVSIFKINSNGSLTRKGNVITTMSPLSITTTGIVQ